MEIKWNDSRVRGGWVILAELEDGRVLFPDRRTRDRLWQEYSGCPGAAACHHCLVDVGLKNGRRVTYGVRGVRGPLKLARVFADTDRC